MSDITTGRTTGESTGAIATVQEAYSFACMRCGYGWEQSYDIEHHVDASGNEFVMYMADGQRVPSPLSRPTCMNCGGHVVRIMQAGQVSSVLDMLKRQHHAPKPPKQSKGDGDEPTNDESHHWHLSDLLHPFQHHHRKSE
ncbi:hypothetical protein [Streptomyces sp. NBC_01304]|uniref:hypothetical protein n=1 Tax=Streptomyces sp. NBC_01304 TaxID=2903818 RepID=UPI002E0F8DC3|nr:hypothetical protein OG430_28730 [Streptomyces sp. NBC_01304]